MKDWNLILTQTNSDVRIFINPKSRNIIINSIHYKNVDEAKPDIKRMIELKQKTLYIKEEW